MPKLRILGLCAAVLLLGAPTTALAQIAGAPWTTLRPTAPLPPQTESGRVDVGDVELYYAIYGRGRPVVLLHPGLGHSDYWANQVGPLSPDYQVVVVDMRGHGRSGSSDRPFTYELLANDILAVIRKLKLKQPAIVGWGDGAVVGLELARRHPRRVGRLIAFGLTYDVAGQQPGVDQTATFIDYVHKAAADYARVAPEPGAFDATFDKLEALWAAEPHYTAAQLKAVKTPTAILAAEHDEWARPEHMQEAAGLIPGAKTVVLPAVSHFAPWQAPKMFNDAVRLMLR
ncbi:MAG TPA: alpha/beta hydrolase [Caulobacteraceae bacterium]|nr:alpha/beta hydrolase [Caulobacteraceae bacterium]